MIPALSRRIKRMQSLGNFNSVYPELSWEEKAAVNAYTDYLYKELNPYLRGQTTVNPPRAKELLVYSDLISLAINKIKNIYRGIVYRGFELNNTDFHNYVGYCLNNKNVLEKGFCSTSYSPGGFFNHCNARLIITSKSGIQIEGLSKYKYETEVLFDKNTLFEIEEVRISKSGAANIIIHEV